jgi:hypothetical protein
VRDIVVRSVDSPSTGYTDSVHPASVTISQTGFPGQRVTLEVRDGDGVLIDTEKITFSSDRGVITIDLDLPLENEGLQQFSVGISPLESEWSADNNSSFFSVDVSDSKVKILDIAFEHHPDVRLMRSILLQDANIELTTLTKGVSGFIEENNSNFDEYDLIVIHGFSATEAPAGFLDALKQTPTLYLRKPISYAFTGPSFILNRSRSREVFQVGFYVNENTSEHPILELGEIGFRDLPPLFSTLDTRVDVPDAVTLLKGTFEDIPGDQPVLSILERGSIRRAELSPWGWYRIYQSPDESERQYVTELFSNLVNWVSNDPNDNRLQIAPVKPVFDPSEEVLIEASLRNESGDPESGAVIEVFVENEQATGRSYSMQAEGQGAYSLSLDNMAPGRYSYSAVARKGDREIDSKTGEFLVNKSNTEFIYTDRNDELLNTLAVETGGAYLPFQQVDELWDILNSNGLTQVRQVETEGYVYPVRSYWWFVVVLLLLAGEWLIRKKYSLP